MRSQGAVCRDYSEDCFSVLLCYQFDAKLGPFVSTYFQPGGLGFFFFSIFSFFDLLFECIKHLQASNHSEYFDIFFPLRLLFSSLVLGLLKLAYFQISYLGTLAFVMYVGNRKAFPQMWIMKHRICEMPLEKEVSETLCTLPPPIPTQIDSPNTVIRNGHQEHLQ